MLIEMQHVFKTYKNGVVALSDITLSIDKGEFVYLIGPSGAGKSTWIKLLYREELPSKGKMLVNGFDFSRFKSRHTHRLRRTIGVVFQDYRLIERLTVEENIAFAMEVVEAPARDIRRRVNELLYLVGLKAHAKRFPRELSGGEQQRVAIARALANKPELLIADEPTGNLDYENSLQIIKLLEEINLQGTTVVMATHDRDIVNRFRRRVLELSEGRLLRDEAKGVYDRP